MKYFALKITFQLIFVYLFQYILLIKLVIHILYKPAHYTCRITKSCLSVILKYFRLAVDFVLAFGMSSLLYPNIVFIAENLKQVCR